MSPASSQVVCIGAWSRGTRGWCLCWCVGARLIHIYCYSSRLIILVQWMPLPWSQARDYGGGTVACVRDLEKCRLLAELLHFAAVRYRSPGDCRKRHFLLAIVGGKCAICRLPWLKWWTGGIWFVCMWVKRSRLLPSACHRFPRLPHVLWDAEDVWFGHVTMASVSGRLGNEALWVY